jgi:hypothetical protein
LQNNFQADLGNDEWEIQLCVSSTEATVPIFLVSNRTGGSILQGMLEMEREGWDITETG